LPVEYEDVLSPAFIERHWKRLWRLHVTGSEICCQLPRLPRNHNRQGKVIGGSDKGPLHLQPVHQVYPTKESLQPKRYPGPSHWHHLRLRLP
jgi:acetyl-CoA carboxylase/biotin carboxylase 1